MLSGKGQNINVYFFLLDYLDALVHWYIVRHKVFVPHLVNWDLVTLGRGDSPENSPTWMTGRGKIVSSVFGH